MSNDTLNTLVLTVVLALVTGFGVYMTQKKQPARLERLEKEETALRLRQAEVEELLVEKASSSERAEDALRRWNSRYKVLPEDLTSPAVVDYLNALSGVGFKTFNVSLNGLNRGSDYSTLSYGVQGEAYFGSLYQFIWNIENGRGLYRIRDLDVEATTMMEPNPETGVDRREDIVRFSMTVEAYFAGADGMSAPDSIITVPDEVLPARITASDPFYPLVLDALPPNTDNLVDVEADSLVSVIGQMAVFRDELGARPLRVGDRVYLGQIERIDQNEAVVTADLNKGGIRERVEISLATGERFRQALGGHRLAQLNGIAPIQAPPAPGTPEAKRAAREAERSRAEAGQATPYESSVPTTTRVRTPPRAQDAAAQPRSEARTSDLPIRLPQDQQSLTRTPQPRQDQAPSAP
jgi:hypothetical protein